MVGFSLSATTDTIYSTSDRANIMPLQHHISQVLNFEMNTEWHSPKQTDRWPPPTTHTTFVVFIYVPFILSFFSPPGSQQQPTTKPTPLIWKHVTEWVSEG